MTSRSRWIAGATFAIGAAALVSPIRRHLEADMARQMLIEFPLLLAGGWGLAGLLSARVRSMIAAVDRLGLASGTLVTLTLALWMIPVALDASLERPGYALAKYASLGLAGAMLRGVAARQPLPIQAFFVGGLAWMTATVGLIYQEAPQALCVYYLPDMQQRAGFGLAAFALVGGVLWCVCAQRRLAAADRPKTARSEAA